MRIVAVSDFVQGLLTWALPLLVFVAVVLWYFVLVRRRHPD